MDKPLARVVLFSVVVAMSLGGIAACARAKPERDALSQPTDALQTLALVTATAQVALPVVGGVDDAAAAEALVTATVTALPEPSPTATSLATAAVVESAPTTVMPESTPAPPDTITHTVRVGDTLLSIAIQYNTTPQAIRDLNGLSDPDLIRLGQMLLIPATPIPDITFVPAPTVTPTIVYHVVRAGETLSGIAAQYRTTSAALARANNIANPHMIRVGQRLIIAY